MAACIIPCLLLVCACLARGKVNGCHEALISGKTLQLQCLKGGRLRCFEHTNRDPAINFFHGVVTLANLMLEREAWTDLRLVLVVSAPKHPFGLACAYLARYAPATKPNCCSLGTEMTVNQLGNVCGSKCDDLVLQDSSSAFSGERSAVTAS